MTKLKLLPMSNGLLVGILACKSVEEINHWISLHSDNDIEDEIKHYETKYDLTDQKFKAINLMINNLKIILKERHDKKDA